MPPRSLALACMPQCTRVHLELLCVVCYPCNVPLLLILRFHAPVCVQHCVSKFYMIIPL